MEYEDVELRRKYVTCRASLRSCRERLKHESSRSRIIISAVSNKLEEANKEIRTIEAARQSELSWVMRELLLLQSKMTKEQKRLTKLIGEKEEEVTTQQAEMERLRKQNKRLNMLVANKMKKSAALEAAAGDTSTSEDSSPKSSFSKMSKIEIKQRIPAETIKEAESSPSSPLHTAVDHPSQPRVPPSPSHYPDSSLSMSPSSPNPVAVTPSRTKSPKPPVPSRAGVNKKLQIPPAPPPHRTNVSKTETHAKDERVDSGRESDETFDSDVGLVLTNKTETDPNTADVIVNSVKRADFLAASSPRSSGRSVITLGDVDDNFEEFVVDLSPGDNNGHHPKCRPVVDMLSPIHQMTKHKTGLKPSDIKYRDRLRTVMSGVTQMEEQVDEKTTVTYWTEPFL